MALSTPCDVCHVPLRDAVVTVRFTTLGVIHGVPTAARPIPLGRPSEYLLCASCAAGLDDAIRLLETHHGVPRGAAG